MRKLVFLILLGIICAVTALYADVQIVKDSEGLQRIINRNPYVVVLCTASTHYLEGVSWDFAGASKVDLFLDSGVVFVQLVMNQALRNEYQQKWDIQQLPAVALIYQGKIDRYQDGQTAVLEGKLNRRKIIQFILEFWRDELEKRAKTRVVRRVYRREPNVYFGVGVGAGYPYYGGYYPYWYSPYTYYGNPYYYPYEYPYYYGGPGVGFGFSF